MPSCRSATFVLAAISCSSFQLISDDRQRGGFREAAVVNPLIGSTASLDEDGYQQVVAATVAAKSNEQMTQFVQRICVKEGLHVSNENAYASFEKYFDGECASQSYDALRLGLLSASRKPKACGGGWIQYGWGRYKTENISSPDYISLFTSELDQSTHDIVDSVLRKVQEDISPEQVSFDEGLKIMIETDSSKAMAAFVSSAVGVLGGEVVDPLRLSMFSQEFYATLEMRLRKINTLPGSWLKLHDRDKTVVHLDESVQSATLDEEGYMTIAKMNDDDKMIGYMRRICEHEGFHIDKESIFRAMSPHYTAECGIRSYKALLADLDRKAHPLRTEHVRAERKESCNWGSDP